MPELPEVETVCRGLGPVLVGQVIARVDMHRKDLRKPFPKNLKIDLCFVSIIFIIYYL